MDILGAGILTLMDTLLCSKRGVSIRDITIRDISTQEILKERTKNKSVFKGKTTKNPHNLGKSALKDEVSQDGVCGYFEELSLKRSRVQAEIATGTSKIQVLGEVWPIQ
jgi:hypothetical protein